jgi:hypothetical protein
VRRFRERTKERLATLDRFHEAMPAEVFEERFGPKFMEKVESKRGEWIDALRDLEAACEAYARPAGEASRDASVWSLSVLHRQNRWLHALQRRRHPFLELLL